MEFERQAGFDRVGTATRSTAMPQYHIYLLKDGHIYHPSIVVECNADAEAIREAKQYVVKGVDIELWDGARRVWMSPPPEQK
jgi:hypothetical protein